MSTQNKKAFTLVELIIVVTILSILTTIGFMSFNGSTSEARDSSRLASLKIIRDGLVSSYAKNQVYPIPDDYVEILGVSKQGYVGENVSKMIRGSNFIDPKENINYTYSIDYTGKKIQLTAFLELAKPKHIYSSKYSPIQYSFANNINYTDRNSYTVGDSVCAIMDTSTNLPVNYILTGTLDIAGNSSEYKAICNNTSSGTTSGTGQTLLTNISIIQNSCVLGNTVVTSGQRLTAYNKQKVAYNQTCAPVSRYCNNGVLSGDPSYMYDTCSPSAALNCNATTYNGYTIPAINHGITQTISKAVTGGVRDISASCVNGELTYGTENINCSTNYVLDNGQCMQDICTGSAPDWSIANGIQKYNVSWTHNIVAGQCTFVCQAGYYWNNSYCSAASIGYIVANQGQTTQTACTDNNTYQDLTGQTSCKTVSSGYYSTPVGAGAKTGQTQCEANNYCVSGVKTACATGYSSPAGSTSSAACAINQYTVSGNFGTNANGATVNLCGKTVTANSSGVFSITANYATVCNNVIVTRPNYTCTTTTNGPASLVSNISNIAGNCVAHTQVATCGTIPANSIRNTATSITQTWNGTAWLPSSTSFYNTTASTTDCRYKCNTGYHTENSGTTCVSNTRSCYIENGTGVQTWGGTSRGVCTVVSCNVNYSPY